jgi:hypothetical protein
MPNYQDIPLLQKIGFKIMQNMQNNEINSTNNIDIENENELKPITISDLRKSSLESDDELQLKADIINVCEKRKDIAEFPIAYQKKIKDYYRFAPLPINSLAASAHTNINQRQGK